jgi:tetratricopeptide (TPR) repeat protein
MRFQVPSAGEPAAAPAPRGVALPPPSGAGPAEPARPTLEFGEVELPGEAPSPAEASPFEASPPETPPFAEPSPFEASPPGEPPFAQTPPFEASPSETPPFAEPSPFEASPPEASPFAEEPLPVAPDLPPPPDPFSSAPGSPPPAGPPAAGTRVAVEEGPGALGKKETEELEALFEEVGVAPAPARPRAPAGPEWRIRRRSGKVFGPFPEAEVVQMLTRGELLGNEEVSSDGGSAWSAIGEEAAFADAIRKLIEQPGAEGPERPLAGASQPAPAVARARGPGLGDRLAVLRLRTAATFDRLPGWARYAIPGAVLALVLGAGLGVGWATDYGIFLHRLWRGQVGPHRPGAKLCAEARVRFAEDGWKAAQAALALAERAIALSPVDREAKGLQAQVAFWMARRTGVAPAALERARAYVAEIEQKSPRAVDTLKARVSLAASQGRGQGQLPAAAELERWLVQSPRDEDAVYLLGEWALAAGDAGRAASLFGRLDQLRATARSAHALGLAAEARGDGKAAAAQFAEALKRDPKHLSSALELAAISLRAGDLRAAASRLEDLLSSEQRELLGPMERARARQLHGELLARDLGAEPEKRLAEADRELEAAVQEDGGYLPARLAWARFLLRRNAPERALQALEPVAASASPEIADLQARALARAGRVLDAMNTLDAASRSGASPRLTFARGLVLDAGGKRAEAEKLFAEAARDPGYWEPHLALGRSRLRAGDVAGAGPEILLAAEKAPGEPDAQAGLGELRLARGDLAGAEEAFGKALVLDPSHAASHLGMARVALARGDSAAAASSLERAARFDPRLGEARLLLGGLRWKAGDLPGAAAEFKAAAGLDPRNALARTRLGAVELEQGQVEPAYGDLLAASNTEVALAENRFWLGRTLLAKGDATQAVEQLARAVDLDRRNAQHHLWLGIALERASKLGEAADAYREALQVDPRLVEAAERLGMLQATFGRHADAVTWLEKAIQLAPREQRLRMELADCRMKLGQAAQAIQIYKDALRADPKLVALYYRIARAVHESSGAAEAVPWYEKAAQLDRQNPMPHYYLGFHYKVRGKRARAIEAFRAYLKLKPDADDRKDIEREIEDLGG